MPCFLAGHGAVDNDKEITALVHAAAADVVGAKQVVEPELSLAGEDFACFQDEVPGCIFFLGTGTKGSKPLHSPEFAFDDSILPTGSEVFCRSALKILNRK